MAKDCLLCQIAVGEEPSEIVWQNENWIAIHDKYPKAETHVLILPKSHIDKQTLLFGTAAVSWNDFMDAVAHVVKQLGLDQTGYQLVNYGAGYNHFEHEHMHVLGGEDEAPLHE